ncbi:MAG: hypothetical protein AAB583_00520 [Patescibacteria group bacterium]
MKKRILASVVILLALFLGSFSTAFAAVQVIPQGNAPQNQRDKFQTDLFTGSATYSYSIKVPKGTNDLTPQLNLAYNHQAAHDTAMQNGIGWQLDRDYIYSTSKVED